ncbi:histidine acid phosphatase family protein [Stylonychia lemnae]|uniref:Histidine acid phosphatase family protein n=1 Tax=Stylonychia lemnae TaxID=5949 RepID=A0A078AVS3_STYLE|nr:histidine acid phosphatase family protein [Stylonychia lemnae]|eukprot:CDW86186.1 histidine acid phosphatase family protein [Stylonychia lemnae]
MHGSKSPLSQDIINATKVNYPQGLGQLTPMGMRQMYLRGREIRRRYVENQNFLTKYMVPTEIYAYASPSDRTYMSAMAHMMGLYPPGGPQPLSPNQTQNAVPPMPIENLEQIQEKLGEYALENNFQTIPIHSDAGDLESMLTKGYDPAVCPIIGEIQMFEAINNTQVNHTFQNYTNILYPLLQNKFKLNKSEPFDMETARYIIDEINSNKNEKRYVNYEFTQDEWKLIDQFEHDYMYSYSFLNDTVVQLATTEQFKFILKLFDRKANASLGHINNTNAYTQNLKYYYSSIKSQHLTAIIKGLQLPEQFRYLPKYSSSLLIEFWQKDYPMSQEEDTHYERYNYYVKFFYDDVPFKLSGAECDNDYKCQWDKVANVLQGRLFRDVVNNGTYNNNMRQFCFSHLNYEVTASTYEENLPWWLAFIIALPLVGITVAIIKIFLIIRDKKLRAQAQQSRGNYGVLNAS